MVLTDEKTKQKAMQLAEGYSMEPGDLAELDAVLTTDPTEPGFISRKSLLDCSGDLTQSLIDSIIADMPAAYERWSRNRDALFN